MQIKCSFNFSLIAAPKCITLKLAFLSQTKFLTKSITSKAFSVIDQFKIPLSYLV